jgi:hypothetical protein
MPSFYHSRAILSVGRVIGRKREEKTVKARGNGPGYEAVGTSLYPALRASGVWVVSRPARQLDNNVPDYYSLFIFGRYRRLHTLPATSKATLYAEQDCQKQRRRQRGRVSTTVDIVGAMC